jgi:FAD/FMN-containing dehydrogenase
VFQPSTSKEVSIAVLLARLTDCPFAAKSGGHAAFAGASNAPAGISIWLKDLNGISLNGDESVASIGPGNTWRQVYQALEPHGLAVVGGRASTIGVGGFVLGGGISFYANLYGWAVDNVQSFEVLLQFMTVSKVL